MKVLLAHNFYQQPGGEDQVFADEGWLLESHGHQVVRFTVDNDDVTKVGRLRLAAQTIWNSSIQEQLRQLIRSERPEVVHFQNTFPLISPAAYYAVRSEGVAVVQELQNYRLLCPKAVLLRDGRVCEDCVGKFFAWPGIVHGCYRGSRATTAVVAAMLSVHKLAGTWAQAVDAYITNTEFGRTKLIEGGLPTAKMHVKPNFINPDPGVGAGDGGYAVFVGRLSPEKGIDTLLSAWQKLGGAIPLKILGDGPMAAQVRQAAQRETSIEWLGRRNLAEVLEIVGKAAMLVFPSCWYEGQPKTILESFAKGTPVIASRLGAMQEMLDHGRNGLLFAPGDADDLAAQAQRLINNPREQAEMRSEARREYENQYTPPRNYEKLMGIYQRAIEARPRRKAG